MRRERTDQERLTDNAVLLTLWARGQELSEDGAAGDRLKLMKLAFLASYPLYVDRVKALNLRFFRWKWGPMSDQVYDTWDDLIAHKLLLDEEQLIVSDEGMRLARSFEDEVLALPENAEAHRAIQAAVNEGGAMATPDLLDRVYSMRCYTVDSPGRRRLVRALPMGLDITTLLDDGDTEGSLYIPPGWEVTLDLVFHPDALRNLQRGIEDTHAGRVFGWDAMWTDV